MNKIHSLAMISQDCILGDNNIIGAGVIIKEGCKIGNNNKIEAGAIIGPYCEIGDNNTINHYAYIGGDPQDHEFTGDRSFVIIGNNNIIREYVTIHRGSKADTKTIVGDNNFLMAYTHMGHNSRIGNNCVLTNVVQLAGYSSLDNNVVMGGYSGLHQFCKVGSYAMVGGNTHVNKDIIPYSMAFGIPSKVIGLNTVGLRRAGFSQEDREIIKSIFHLLYLSKLPFSVAIEKIEEQYAGNPFANEIVSFYRSSKRGICGFGYKKDQEE